MKNESPWLTHINRTEHFSAINKNIETDTVIVGAGISGVLTAFYLLENTNKKIILVDAKRIAGGASGHNAGNLTLMLEISIPDLIVRYGEEKVKKSFQSLEHSWDILNEVIKKTEILEPQELFIGYGGYARKEHLRIELENLYYYKLWGIWDKQVLVSIDESIDDFPDHLKNLCSFVPQEEINRILDTKSDTIFFAAIPEKMGVTNSALFSELLALWCIGEYKDRFTIYEHTPIEKIQHTRNTVELFTKEYTIVASEVILCTNGFENITLVTNDVDIDTKFHYNIRGVVGYMAGYFNEEIYSPSALWFYEKESIIGNNPETDDPYFYLTKRSFLYKNKIKGMIVVGGPEIPIEEISDYKKEHEIDEAIISKIDTFVDKTLKESALLDRSFVWHGLMGYTKTGLRIVGREPCASRILYNLGCNGVGIMPAFWSAKRIADIITNKEIDPTIFDPEDFVCMIKPDTNH